MEHLTALCLNSQNLYSQQVFAAGLSFCLSLRWAHSGEIIIFIIPVSEQCRTDNFILEFHRTLGEWDTSLLTKILFLLPPNNPFILLLTLYNWTQTASFVCLCICVGKSVSCVDIVHLFTHTMAKLLPFNNDSCQLYTQQDQMFKRTFGAEEKMKKVF